MCCNVAIMRLLAVLFSSFKNLGLKLSNVVRKIGKIEMRLQEFIHLLLQHGGGKRACERVVHIKSFLELASYFPINSNQIWFKVLKTYLPHHKLRIPAQQKKTHSGHTKKGKNRGNLHCYTLKGV